MKRTKDVTAATNPKHFPATHGINGRREMREMDPTPARRSPIESPKMVSGFRGGIKSRESAPSNFKLPDKVSQKEILVGSFKYGGGRSAGNRSLADNFTRKINQP